MSTTTQWFCSNKPSSPLMWRRARRRSSSCTSGISSSSADWSPARHARSNRVNSPGRGRAVDRQAHGRLQDLPILRFPLLVFEPPSRLLHVRAAACGPAEVSGALETPPLFMGLVSVAIGARCEAQPATPWDGEMPFDAAAGFRPASSFEGGLNRGRALPLGDSPVARRDRGDVRSNCVHERQAPVVSRPRRWSAIRGSDGHQSRPARRDWPTRRQDGQDCAARTRTSARG